MVSYMCVFLATVPATPSALSYPDLKQSVASMLEDKRTVKRFLHSRLERSTSYRCKTLGTVKMSGKPVSGSVS